MQGESTDQINRNSIRCKGSCEQFSAAIFWTIVDRSSCLRTQVNNDKFRCIMRATKLDQLHSISSNYKISSNVNSSVDSQVTQHGKANIFRRCGKICQNSASLEKTIDCEEGVTNQIGLSILLVSFSNFPSKKNLDVVIFVLLIDL